MKNYFNITLYLSVLRKLTFSPQCDKTKKLNYEL